MSETHTVLPGEYMEIIAEKFAFRDYRLIYDHANNQAFKKLRPNPHILYPGDKVFIPDKDPGLEAAGTDKKHKYVIKSPIIKLILRIHRNGKPFAKHKYTLKVGKLTFSGTTAADGLIQRDIPIGEPTGDLTFPGRPSYTRKLNLGFLHPITVTSGVQMRLNNLGFGCGPATGAPSSAYTSALQAFQKQHSLSNQTGSLDNDTLNALRLDYEQGTPS
jgi:hypothetical protein